MPALCQDYEAQLATVARDQLDKLELRRPAGDGSSNADLLNHHAEEMTGDPASVRRGRPNSGEDQIGRERLNSGEDHIDEARLNSGEDHIDEAPSGEAARPKRS